MKLYRFSIEYFEYIDEIGWIYVPDTYIVASVWPEAVEKLDQRMNTLMKDGTLVKDWCVTGIDETSVLCGFRPDTAPIPVQATCL